VASTNGNLAVAKASRQAGLLVVEVITHDHVCRAFAWVPIPDTGPALPVPANTRFAFGVWLQHPRGVFGPPLLSGCDLLAAPPLPPLAEPWQSAGRELARLRAALRFTRAAA
jgi:hypothetical protein